MAENPHSALRLRRGLGRAVMVTARYLRPLQSYPVRMVDGRVLHLDLREPMCMPYLLLGAIWEEEGETDFVRSVVRPGESAVDIGANVGWYTTLLAGAVGPEGRVWAFEPNPAAARLVRASTRDLPQCTVVPQAVADHNNTVDLFVPLDAGMASLQAPSALCERRQCRCTTIDDFLGNSESQKFLPVTFIKCDAEGAELSILAGATKTLASQRPPLLLMEINREACERFGYAPEQIYEFLERVPAAGYRGFRINSQTARIEPLPNPVTFRFDAVFVPAWLWDRVAQYGRERGQTEL